MANLANVSCKAILTHQWASFDKATQQEFDDYVKKMEAPWASEVPMTLFAPIEVCRRFATSGEDTISNKSPFASSRTSLPTQGASQNLVMLGAYYPRPKQHGCTSNTLSPLHTSTSTQPLKRQAGYHSVNVVTESCFQKCKTKPLS
jgi:hypothetical protein